ncbi:TonB-dependent receptor [Sphingomonas oligophenolica]|uniref:TonB-dependent receptor n=1 Tax=Sphingomonas oligophenolica TaxID=301154 RepID=A0ABU9Y4K4_9SPHN
MVRGISLAVAASLCGTALPAFAQDRSGENAVTQAEDAFGYSVGRETIGIYTASSARGFSPTAAGNVRIDGLYFDPQYALTSIVSESSSIKVGLSAQGYPYAAPSGIVDYSLRRPESRAAASIILNGDSYGSYGIEIDGSLPLGHTLSLGYGITGNHVEFPDGTNNFNHAQGLILRWRPAPGVEIVPFWTLSNDYNDEAGTYYIPAGHYIPPQPHARRFDGPGWADFRYTGANHGVLASYAPAKDWIIRVGAFRSVFDQKTSFTNLLLNLHPDGTGDRVVIADPRAKNTSLSGELRITHSIADGPRLHVIHLSVRERDARREFGGSDSVDLGPTHLGDPVTTPEPAFVFTRQGHDRVRQATYGLAYDGRWKDVGELSFGLSRADYTKTTVLPGLAPVIARSHPWLYNGTLALTVAKPLSLYAGYSRGLEESGLAPPNAANRNQPLPTILTEQKDAGLRWLVTGTIKAVAGAFDLRRPYFSLDSAGNFTQTGTTRSQGAEFSLAGDLTKRLNLVAGGYMLHPRVERDAAAVGVIGPRPVGLPSHLFNLNLNWRTPLLDGLSLDAAVFQRGTIAATTDNSVILPSRTQLNLGGRYGFKLSGHPATFRLQAVNIFDDQGFGSAGPGIYSANSGRYFQGYLAIDV